MLRVLRCGGGGLTPVEAGPDWVLPDDVAWIDLTDPDRAEELVAEAALGVFLPTGVALEIDGTAVGRVPFNRCLPQVCMAIAEASPETLEKLKKGKEANFIIYEAPGIGLPMKLSLSGFTASLSALEKN